MGLFANIRSIVLDAIAFPRNQCRSRSEYLQEENRVLKAQLGQRLRLSDEQRRRLAAKRERTWTENSSRKLPE